LGGLDSLLKFAENLWEEFLFEALLCLDFSSQTSAGLGAFKQRHSEKAGTIVRASSKFMAIGGLVRKLWQF